jgi:catechol 2,3-dioxygenase-like lactoylglutathione lyase family enzyme
MRKTMKEETAVLFPGNNRIHVALAATDLVRSRAFYETLLGVPPSKERPGYVKFEPVDPSVNLTLNEVEKIEANESLPTHFGIQVKSTEAVTAAIQRMEKAGLKTSVEENTTCCYAVQNKVWATDPDGNQWEVFVVLEADADQRKDDDSTCCVTEDSTNAACC